MKVNDILNKPTPTVDQLARQWNLSQDKIQQELARGIKVELEHTNSRQVAREIALDHLGEDPGYYSKLTKAGLE